MLFNRPLAHAALAASVIGAQALAQALTEFRPGPDRDSLDVHLDAAELAWSCRSVLHLEALRFRPWAREALEEAAELFEGLHVAWVMGTALSLIATHTSPVSPLAKEVSYAAHA